jgi:predicted AAA+ superfamily ATPase
MINRIVNIAAELQEGKTLLILGPRRVGKTTLVSEFLRTSNKKYISFDGGNFDTINIFSKNSLSTMRAAIAGFDVVFIDEAQEIPTIGKSLKLINDHFPNVAVIASGSSSFELNNQVGEPLVGRSNSKFLYPFSIKEILDYYTNTSNFVKWNELKDNLLVYGMYPESVLAENNQQRQEYLKELINNLLLKDILKYQEVKGSQFLYNLLILLAYQIGKEVSIEELGKNLGISKNTVNRYLDLLEKAYIIFPLTGFSRNLRSEITKMNKYYFYDVGIRNALINNFNPIDFRIDKGDIWENFVVVERMKHQS